MSEKLKPCPFCGGEAKAFFCEASGTYDVQCQQCGALPFLGRKRGSGRFKSMDDVIVAWNRRAERTCQFFYDEKPGEYMCSACGEQVSGSNPDDEYQVSDKAVLERFNFCPHCGARVVSER